MSENDTPAYLHCFCGHVAKTRYEMARHLHTHIGSQWLEWRPDQWQPDKTFGPKAARCFCGFKFSTKDHASGDTLCRALQDHFEKMGGPAAHFLEHQLKGGT